MIRKIRWKFIRIAMAVLSVTMLVIAVVINLANWVNVRSEIQETLAVLAESWGKGNVVPEKRGRTRRMQSTLEESRYFMVYCTRDGEYIIRDASRISEKTEEELQAIVLPAMASGRNSGRAGDYQYLVRWEDSGRGIAVFLNCETKFDALRRLALLSAIACADGIGIAWLLVFLFSGRAIRPLIRNAEEQKRFITDAGHELKTPLAVIAANMDALELETEKNEWIDSTREQLGKMKKLVSELTFLSRLDEEGAALTSAEIDFSALIRSEAESFQGMAEFQGKSLETEIEEGLTVAGDPEALRKVIGQLCDNALRYAPEGDTIRLTAGRNGRQICLAEENSLAEPMSEETLSRLFDRFYRPDASRSRESGGTGIGLSMIRAVAEKHGGQARAEITKEGRIRFLCILPEKGPHGGPPIKRITRT